MAESAKSNLLTESYASAEPVIVRLPPLHEHQNVFLDWEEKWPTAQVLIAPCGVKLGKSFASALWLVLQALANPGFYCVWVAPTLFKARVGYRYVKAMLPDIPLVRTVDGSIEVRLANGSFIKFVHGRDAEVTIEGEAIDAFVVDEAGKQTRQLWLSLITTITQTLGKGIITGTPRGFTWYAELFKKAKAGDPFFAWCQLSTELSPYVLASAIENAKRLLPKHLFDQYYRALFVSFSTVFGDLDDVWDESLPVELKRGRWLHPDAGARALDTCTGADWAKINDWTVFTTINSEGVLVGYWRFRGGPYPKQVARLKTYMAKFTGDRSLNFDKTGVGQAIEDLITDAEIDANINGITYTNASKQDMVTRASAAFSEGWFRSPRLERVEAELTALEVTTTKTGRHSYAAPEGEHDDVAWSVLMAIDGAYSDARANVYEQMIEDTISGKVKSEDEDDIEGYADAGEGEGDDDWSEEDDEGGDDFDDSALDE